MQVFSKIYAVTLNEDEELPRFAVKAFSVEEDAPVYVTKVTNVCRISVMTSGCHSRNIKDDYDAMINFITTNLLQSSSKSSSRLICYFRDNSFFCFLFRISFFIDVV